MLYHDFLTNDEKLIHKWLHYFPIYERYLKKYVNQSVVFMEIGCGEGGSLQMWKRYLGPFARIVGIDINPACKDYEEGQIKVYIGDQSNEEFLASVVNDLAKDGLSLDVVIDDGSHMMSHVCASFDFLYDRLSKNGTYIVEDLHTAYWPEYGGGINAPGTFIEYCKPKIDALNAHHIREGADHSFADTTFSMAFYDSVAVFEKAQWLSGSRASVMKP